MTRKPLHQPLPCGRAPSAPSKTRRDSLTLLKVMTEKLEAFVAANHLNRSEVRAKILEVLVEETKHFRAQDLVDKLQVRFPDEVGRSTVYRNLPVLVDSGLIQEGPSAPDGEVLYELADEHHHDHIVCLDCRNIFEFHDELLEDCQTRVTKNMDFTVRDHRHVLYVTCNRLAKKVSMTK